MSLPLGRSEQSIPGMVRSVCHIQPHFIASQLVTYNFVLTKPFIKITEQNVAASTSMLKKMTKHHPGWKESIRKNKFCYIPESAIIFFLKLKYSYNLQINFNDVQYWLLHPLMSDHASYPKINGQVAGEVMGKVVTAQFSFTGRAHWTWKEALIK